MNFVDVSEKTIYKINSNADKKEITLTDKRIYVETEKNNYTKTIINLENINYIEYTKEKQKYSIIELVGSLFLLIFGIALIVISKKISKLKVIAETLKLLNINPFIIDIFAIIIIFLALFTFIFEIAKKQPKYMLIINTTGKPVTINVTNISKKEVEKIQYLIFETLEKIKTT